MKTRLLALVFMALGVTLASCESVAPDRALAPETLEEPTALFSAHGALRCPTPRTETDVALIGPSGGTIELAGHALRIPPGAVREPTHFLIEVPRGPELRVHISPVGAAGYQFGRAAELTLSYARCTERAIERFELQIIHLREDGTAEGKGGVVDADARTVTAPIDHLSGYAISTG